jgi:hypothetical protein
MKCANNFMTPEDLRSEEMISGAMTGNLQQTVSNLKFLKSPVQLEHAGGPDQLRQRPVHREHKFEKEFMLAALLIS